MERGEVGSGARTPGSGRSGERVRASVPVGQSGGAVCLPISCSSHPGHTSVGGAILDTLAPGWVFVVTYSLGRASSSCLPAVCPLGMPARVHPSGCSPAARAASRGNEAHLLEATGRDLSREPLIGLECDTEDLQHVRSGLFACTAAADRSGHLEHASHHPSVLVGPVKGDRELDDCGDRAIVSRVRSAVVFAGSPRFTPPQMSLSVGSVATATRTVRSAVWLPPVSDTHAPLAQLHLRLGGWGMGWHESHRASEQLHLSALSPSGSVAPGQPRWPDNHFRCAVGPLSDCSPVPRVPRRADNHSSLAVHPLSDRSPVPRVPRCPDDHVSVAGHPPSDCPHAQRASTPGLSTARPLGRASLTGSSAHDSASADGCSQHAARRASADGCQPAPRASIDGCSPAPRASTHGFPAARPQGRASLTRLSAREACINSELSHIARARSAGACIPTTNVARTSEARSLAAAPSAGACEPTTRTECIKPGPSPHHAKRPSHPTFPSRNPPREAHHLPTPGPYRGRGMGAGSKQHDPQREGRRVACPRLCPERGACAPYGVRPRAGSAPRPTRN